MLITMTPFLGAVAITQVLLSLACLKQFSAAKVPALLLLVVSPFQFLAAAFGELLIGSLHTPSSFDPIGDGFDIVLRAICCVAAAFVTSAILSVWVSLSIVLSKMVVDDAGLAPPPPD